MRKVTGLWSLRRFLLFRCIIMQPYKLEQTCPSCHAFGYLLWRPVSFFPIAKIAYCEQPRVKCENEAPAEKVNIKRKCGGWRVDGEGDVIEYGLLFTVG